MRALVLGGTGMLGQAVTSLWRHRGQAVLALGREQADITNGDRLLYWADSFQPTLIINCAAFTQVDACEEQRDHALAVNGSALDSIVAAARRCSARLIHISSDYVFNGQGDAPLPEDTPTDPRSVYGESKLLGEQCALTYEKSLVLRASWLFGPGGPNFVATIRRLLLEGKTPLKVVEDQVGRPTYTPYLAEAIWHLSRVEAHGLMHYGNREPTSWHGLACQIARVVQPQAEVLPVPTSAFPRPAERPAWSVLDVSRYEATVGRTVEPWLCGLVEYLTRH